MSLQIFNTPFNRVVLTCKFNQKISYLSKSRLHIPQALVFPWRTTFSFAIPQNVISLWLLLFLFSAEEGVSWIISSNLFRACRLPHSSVSLLFYVIYNILVYPFCFLVYHLLSDFLLKINFPCTTISSRPISFKPLCASQSQIVMVSYYSCRWST